MAMVALTLCGASPISSMRRAFTATWIAINFFLKQIVVVTFARNEWVENKIDIERLILCSLR
jgi:hypothetical protein